jgi:hypothetical protein
MRVRMYAEDYEDLELARSAYRTLSPGGFEAVHGGDGVSRAEAALGGGVAAVCLNCAHQACRSSCGYGLDVAKLTVRAHQAVVG